MQAIKFKNFSGEDFTWKYDGVPYTFKAGSETYLENFKATHFCKHLVDRELNRKGTATNYEPARKELEALCYPSDEVVTPMEAINIEEKKKRGKKVEKEFPDLKK